MSATSTWSIAAFASWNAAVTSATSADRRRIWPVMASRTGERKKRNASTVSARVRPAPRGLGAVQAAHLLGFLQQDLALRLLRRGDVLDDELERALAPAPELVALLGGKACLPRLARVAGPLHAAMQLARHRLRRVRQSLHAVSMAPRRVDHRLQARAQEASVTAGRLVALDLAGIGPAAERVGADPHQARGRPEREPGIVGIVGGRLSGHAGREPLKIYDLLR